MSASDQLFLAKCEARQERHSAIVRSLEIAYDAADDAADDDEIAYDAADDASDDSVLADVFDARGSDDEEYDDDHGDEEQDFVAESEESELEANPPRTLSNNTFAETEEDKEKGFAEEPKKCCRTCNKWRLTGQYDMPTQLYLDANPVHCSMIGRSCSEPDDRLDMGVSTRTIVLDQLSNGMKTLVVDADEGLLFQGIHGLNKNCDFMATAGYAMVQMLTHKASFAVRAAPS